ncbi:unnamed protein product, partial [Rotaria magnacalcarata]
NLHIFEYEINESNCVSSSDIDQLAQRFDKPDVVQAIILTGSYARNEAGSHSDIDLVRFVSTGSNLLDDGTYVHEKKILINLLIVEPEEYTKWFTDPCEAIKWIAGIRIARAIIDRENFFINGLQVRALSSDNNAFMEVELALGENTQIIKLLRIVFGIFRNYTLRQRVIVGLQLYVLLAEHNVAYLGNKIC